MWAEAEAERAAGAGWEPPDWEPLLRARRRRDLLVLGALTAFLVAVPVVRLVVQERPPALSFWFGAAFVLVHLLLSIRSHGTAAGRAEWENATRQEIRLEQALRHHTSSGVADRAAVTARAEQLDRNSGVAVVAYPLLLLLAVAFAVESDLSPVQVFGVVALAALVCGALLIRSLRRGRMGTRWLADPLPRDAGCPT